MLKRKLTTRRGFTLIESAIAILLAAIVVLGISVILVDSQRGWHVMYNRIYSDVVTDGYVARKTFDAVVRKASAERLLLDDAGTWVEVYYYANGDSIVVDRYTRFYYEQGDDSDNPTGQLCSESGTLDPDGVKETLTTQTICENVSDCVFKEAGRSVQMILTLDNGLQIANIVSSAVMHN